MRLSEIRKEMEYLRDVAKDPYRAEVMCNRYYARLFEIRDMVRLNDMGKARFRQVVTESKSLAETLAGLRSHLGYNELEILLIRDLL